MVSFAQELRQRAYEDSKRTFTELPELDLWTPDLVLPGDLLQPLVFNVHGYTPDGMPLIHDVGDAAATKAAIMFKRDTPHYVSETFYRRGHSIQVSTVYLIWHQSGPHAQHPCVWETAIFIDGRPNVVMRYLSPRAAHKGHIECVGLIRAAQRARRKAWKEHRLIPELTH